MAEMGSLPLPIVDACAFPAALRDVLRPHQLMADAARRLRRLPRFFYEIDSWQTALDMPVAAHFTLWEFLGVDVREHPRARTFPRYVPCAVTVLAAHLEVVRAAVGTYVHIAANGGYRTPAHALTRFASPHCWGTAANIYRIGNDFLDTREHIEQYAAVVRGLVPGAWSRPYGHGAGEADDHLHIDLGHVVSVPRGAGSEGESD